MSATISRTEFGNVSSLPRPARRGGLWHLVAELRRRRVCRAITLYIVAVWVICQITEILSPQLGLPDWTLSLVIILGLVGLPIAFVLSWLFDITSAGLVADGESDSREDVPAGGRGRLNQAIDCGLLLVALLLGAQLAFGAFNTGPVEPASPMRRIAVEPFVAATGGGAIPLALGMVTDLQHEISSRTHLTVIVPRAPFLSADSVSLTGLIAVDAERVRVTVTLVDNQIGEVIWSDVFLRTNTDAFMTSAELARDIAMALPVGIHVTPGAGEPHDS
jgi:adenylate cyclase